MPIELRYDGTEILEYLPGDSGYPPLSAEVRSDQALVSLATAIRSVHDASRSFQARPMSRVWDLAYAAYHFVPLHPIADLPNWGWTEPPDVSARLAMFLESYGSEISASEVLTTAVMRLIAMSQYIEAEVKEGNSRFDVHARENHAQGYLRAASDLLERILDDAL
ncbi:hypothetical protein QCD70_06850 [Agreia sp. PsM10]|nr:hypothetical protein [Agreia sp. PsM10]MDN4639955.1 hypothetical protein [Agreia sp. PsM10]